METPTPHIDETREQPSPRKPEREGIAASVRAAFGSAKEALMKPRENPDSVLVKVGNTVMEYTPQTVLALGVTILGLMHENAKIDAESLRLMQITPTWLGAINAPWDTVGAVLERVPALAASIIAGVAFLTEPSIRREAKKLRHAVRTFPESDTAPDDESL